MSKKQKSKAKTVDTYPTNNNNTSTIPVAKKYPYFLYLQILFAIAIVVMSLVGLFLNDGMILYIPLMLGGLLICQALNIFYTSMSKKGTGYAALVVGIVAVVLFVVLLIIN